MKRFLHRLKEYVYLTIRSRRFLYFDIKKEDGEIVHVYKRTNNQFHVGDIVKIFDTEELDLILEGTVSAIEIRYYETTYRVPVNDNILTDNMKRCLYEAGWYCWTDERP